MKKRFKKFKFRKVHRDYRGKSSHNYSRKHQADTSHAPILVNSDLSAPAIIIYRSEFDYLSKCILDYRIKGVSILAHPCRFCDFILPAESGRISWRRH